MTTIVSSGIQDWIKQFGVNANTILLIIAIGGGGYYWAVRDQASATATARVEARVDRLSDKVDVNNTSSLKRWEEHQDLHKDRNVAISGEAARTNERLNGLESAQRKVDELGYKQAATDTNVSNIQQALKEVQTTVNSQSTSLQVIQELLKRIEAKVTK